MPDVFDEVAPPRDIFDEVAPSRDIFDEVAPPGQRLRSELVAVRAEPAALSSPNAPAPTPVSTFQGASETTLMPAGEEYRQFQLPRAGTVVRPPPVTTFQGPSEVTLLPNEDARHVGEIMQNASASAVEGIVSPMTPPLVLGTIAAPQVAIPLLTATMAKSGGTKLGEGVAALEQGNEAEAVVKLGEAGTALGFAALPALHPGAFAGTPEPGSFAERAGQFVGRNVARVVLPRTMAEATKEAPATPKPVVAPVAPEPSEQLYPSDSLAVRSGETTKWSDVKRVAKMTNDQGQTVYAIWYGPKGEYVGYSPNEAWEYHPTFIKTEPPPAPGAAEAPQPTTPEAGGPSASSQPQATEVHGNLRTQPVEGAREVPIAQGVGGVQPQPGAPDTGVRAGNEAQTQAEVPLTLAEQAAAVAQLEAEHPGIATVEASAPAAAPQPAAPRVALRPALFRATSDITGTVDVISDFVGSPNTWLVRDAKGVEFETPSFRMRRLVAHEAKPTAPPAVEEIEPFGTVRQFRVTREFYNQADKGTYKVGDIITEPQLAKAGIAVPPPATPIAPGPGAATAATDFGPEKPLETSVKNAVTAEKRATRGMPAVEEEARRAWGTVWDDVKQQVADDPGAPDRLVESLRDRPRAINDRESAMLLHQQVSLEDQFNKTVRLMTDAAETGGDRTAIPEHRANLARISDQLLELYNVDKTVGRETARGLNARKMAADETYSLVRMQLAKRAVNDGRPLSPEESAAIKELHDKIAATQKAFDEHVAKSDQRIRELEAQHAADELKIAAAKEAKADAASGTVRDLDAERASIVEGITRQPNTPLRDLRPWIRKLALNLVRSGITERDPLINAVHDVLKDIFPNVTLRETMDAVSGYGDFRPLDPEAAKAKLRDLSGQMQNVAKLEDLLARKALKKTGPERKVPSDEERRLTKLVNEYKRRYGVVVTNPAAQLKGALDAIKTRLTHDIADLEYQIATGKKIVKGPTKVAYDAEATALLARRDALKEQFDAIFGKTELTDEQRVTMAKAALEKSVAEYERRIKAGETRTPKTPSKTPITEQLQVLRDQRDTLRGQLDELRNADTALQEEKAVTALNASITDYERRLAAGDFAPKPAKAALATPILDALRERRSALAKEVAERRAASPEGIAAAEDRRVVDLQAQIADIDAKIAAGDVSLPTTPARPVNEREAAFIKHRDQTRLILQEMREQAGVYDPQRIAAANKALDAAIEEAVRQINEGDLAAKSGKPRLSTPELDAKRAELADLQKIKRELRNAAKPKRTPEEVALAALKTRILNENFDLHRRITEGDFTKRTRTPVALDAAAQLLKAENLKLREQFQRDLVADRLKRQSRFEAGQDLFLKMRRASLLSSPVTLAKLTAAALTRMVSTPLEEVVGAGIGKLPGYSELSARAPVEGGFSTKAEAKAMTTGFMRGIKGSVQILKTGKSDLERVYGRMGREGGFAESDLMPRSWLDWFGELHGALKEPVKQMAFERALQKQIEFGIRNGIDPYDPTTLNGYALNAYKAGRRAIFLQDNVLVSKINGFLATKLDPTTGRPTPGSKLLSTAGRTLLPIVRVPTNIVAETMEYATGSITGNVRLARALRRGIDTLPPEEADLIMRQLKKGSIGAAMLLTGYLLPEFIGGYYQPHEKRDPGDVKVGEIGPVPKSLLHSPLLEALQVGSTVRRVAESSLTKRHPEEQGAMTGIVAAALGLTEEVPAVREMLEVVKAFDPRERGAFFGELGKSFVPQLFQAIARQMDKDSEGEVIPRKPGTVLEHIETGVPGLRQNVPEPKRASR